MENGERPSPREEAGWPPFPMEPRREWHEMVAEEEQEERERQSSKRERGRGNAPKSRRCGVVTPSAA